MDGSLKVGLENVPRALKKIVVVEKEQTFVQLRYNNIYIIMWLLRKCPSVIVRCIRVPKARMIIMIMTGTPVERYFEQDTRMV